MSPRQFFLAGILPILILTGCSQPAQQQITEVREVGPSKRPAPPKTTLQERLGMAKGGGGMSGGGMGGQGGGQQGGAEDPLGGITFHHTMPEGWEAVDKTEMRQVNLRMIANPEVECYFTLLPGGGGGTAANLNRWRGQMGQDPLTPEAIEALPKKQLFQQPATFILIDGTFAGMGKSTPRENYRMYGLMLTHKDEASGREQGFFLKMTGPKAILEGQQANFDLIASTLHAVAPGDQHNHDASGEAPHAEGDGHDHGATTPAEEAKAPASGDSATPAYSWATPAGWEVKAPGMMRVANLGITGQPDVECYLTELSGAAGGLESNINRWQQQMNQPALTPEQVAALPKKPLMGGEAAFVTIDGSYGGMSGAVAKENFRMYGLALVSDSKSLFVKMTGPKDVLAAEEANFLAFAASIVPASSAPTAPEAPAPAAAPAPEAPAPQAAADNPHGVPDPTPAGGFNPDNIQWTAPEGWQQGPEKMMRVVTYTVGNVECYITTLAGEAGGAASNINRWAKQMSQPALDEAAIAALPKTAILGTEGPLVEFSGSFTDMGGASKPDYKLLGTLASAGGSTFFVKLTGPASEVDAQKANFVAFCASLH